MTMKWMAIDMKALLESAEISTKLYAAWKEVDRVAEEMGRSGREKDIGALPRILREMLAASAALAEQARLFHSAVLAAQAEDYKGGGEA